MQPWDGKEWHLYQCVRSSWRQMRGLSFREGIQAALVKLFAKGGGFLERQAGLKLWPELLMAREYKKAMQRLKPELSHLARLIREAIGLGGKTRIFSKEEAAWRSEISGIGHVPFWKTRTGRGGEARVDDQDG